MSRRVCCACSARRPTASAITLVLSLDMLSSHCNSDQVTGTSFYQGGRDVTTTAEVAQEPGTTGALSGRIAGFGGVLFVACIVIQNILKAGVAPKNDASATEVMHYFATHRGVEWVLACLFPIGGIGLALFAGGLCARAFSAGGRAR